MYLAGNICPAGLCPGLPTHWLFCFSGPSALMVLISGLSSAAQRARFVLIENKTTEWAPRPCWKARAKICEILSFLGFRSRPQHGLCRSLVTEGRSFGVLGHEAAVPVHPKREDAFHSWAGMGQIIASDLFSPYDFF